MQQRQDFAALYESVAALYQRLAAEAAKAPGEQPSLAALSAFFEAPSA